MLVLVDSSSSGSGLIYFVLTVLASAVDLSFSSEFSLLSNKPSESWVSPFSSLVSTGVVSSVALSSPVAYFSGESSFLLGLLLAVSEDSVFSGDCCLSVSASASF